MMRTTLFLIVLALFLTVPVIAFAEDEEVDTVEWNGFTFKLEDLEGDELREDDVFVDGTLYLVDFWASYCRPCSQYLPHLEEMVEEYGDRGFVVVIFCVDEAGAISTARATLASEDYPFTILFDPESEVKDELGVRSIPTTVLLDPAGDELWRHVGYSSGVEDDVREEIEAILPELTEEENAEEVEEEVEEEAEVEAESEE